MLIESTLNFDTSRMEFSYSLGSRAPCSLLGGAPADAFLESNKISTFTKLLSPPPTNWIFKNKILTFQTLNYNNDRITCSTIGITTKHAITSNPDAFPSESAIVSNNENDRNIIINTEIYGITNEINSRI